MYNILMIYFRNEKFSEKMFIHFFRKSCRLRIFTYVYP